MAYYNDTKTPAATGNIDFNTDPLAPFTPTRFEVTVSAKNTAGDNVSHLSIGKGEAAWQTSHSIFSDQTGSRSLRDAGSNAIVVRMMERVSGTITNVNVATFVGFTSTGVRFNVGTLSALYQYNVELFA